MNIQSDKQSITIYLWPKDADAIAMFAAGALVACTLIVCLTWKKVKELEHNSAAIQTTEKAIKSK